MQITSPLFSFLFFLFFFLAVKYSGWHWEQQFCCSRCAWPWCHILLQPWAVSTCSAPMVEIRGDSFGFWLLHARQDDKAAAGAPVTSHGSEMLAAWWEFWICLTPWAAPLVAAQLSSEWTSAALIRTGGKRRWSQGKNHLQNHTNFSQFLNRVDLQGIKIFNMLCLCLKTKIKSW